MSLSAASKPHVSDKALKDFAYKVLVDCKKKGELDPLASNVEINYFVDQLTSDQLTQIYGMFFRTGMVQ